MSAIDLIIIIIIKYIFIKLIIIFKYDVSK